MNSRTMIVFPTYIGILLDVIALEIGARKTWVHTRSAGRLQINHNALTAEDIKLDAPALALKVRQSVVYPDQER